MEFVEEAVEDRSEDDANTAEESKAAEEGVAAGKDFSGVGLDGRDGAHPGKDHGGIEEGIEPGEFFEEMIPDHADGKGSQDYAETDGGAASKTRVEKVAGQQGLSAVFEHFMPIYYPKSQKPGLP